MSAHPLSGAFMDAQSFNPANFDPALANPTAADQPLTYRPAPRRAGMPGGDANAVIRQHLPLVRRIAWHVHGSMSSMIESWRMRASTSSGGASAICVPPLFDEKISG